MELTDKQKTMLKATVELIWAKGAHSPQQAAIAYEFTQFVEQTLKEQPKQEEKQ